MPINLISTFYINQSNLSNYNVNNYNS